MSAGKHESDEEDEEKYSEEEEDETRRVKSYYAEDGDEEEEEDEEDEEEESGGGFLDSMFGRGRDSEEETDDEEKYEFDEDFAAHDDDAFEDDDGDEAEADASRDVELENKLETAFNFSATDGEMDFNAFKQALAALGKMYTAEEIDRFFREAVLYQMDKKNLRLSSYDRDDRGLLQRTVSLGVSSRGLSTSTLSLEGFKSYYDKWLTRKIDTEEAAEHFRALVEGAAEIALRSSKKDADDSENGVTNRHLVEMEKSKLIDINDIFIYARDLRRVMVTFSEKLTDEEADQLVRECKPKPLPGAGDGGLERIYFKQYLAMLKDETL